MNEGMKIQQTSQSFYSSIGIYLSISLVDQVVDNDDVFTKFR